MQQIHKTFDWAFRSTQPVSHHKLNLYNISVVPICHICPLCMDIPQVLYFHYFFTPLSSVRLWLVHFQSTHEILTFKLPARNKSDYNVHGKSSEPYDNYVFKALDHTVMNLYFEVAYAKYTVAEV